MRSDYFMPRKIGIKSYCKKTKYSKEHLAYDSIVAKMTKIVNERQQIPYSNYGFLLFLFIERLYCKLQKEGFEEVYFLAREGEFLKRLFELYQEKIAKEYRIASKYLYVSRVATYVPTLGSLENESFNTIFRDYPNIDVKAFLGSIGFEDEEIKQILRETNLSNRKASECISKLKDIPKFVEEYDKKRKQQRKFLKQYLFQEGISEEKKRVAVVDVGWRGTIQDNLYKVLDSEVEVYGYYIGITGKTCYEVKNHKEGLVFSRYPYYSTNYELWSFDKTFLERLLYASHPSTNSYRKRGDRVEPVMNWFRSEHGVYEKVIKIQEEIVKKIVMISDVLNDRYWTADKLSNLFAEIHLKTIFLINFKEMKLQRELLNAHYENFGYIVSYGENSKKVFAVKNILKKIKGNYKRLKSVELVSRVLLNKKIYWGIRVLYFIRYRKTRATLKRYF